MENNENYITKEFCQTINKNMAEKIDNLIVIAKEHTESIGEIKLILANLPQTIIDKTDNRYASKVTEKVVYGLIGLVLMSIFTAIIKLVI